MAEVVKPRLYGYTLAILPVELGFMDKTGVYPFGFKDFTPIMNLNTDPAALTVKAGRFKSVQEFIAYAKANPGKLKVGHSGTGLLWHLAAAVFAKEAAIDTLHLCVHSMEQRQLLRRLSVIRLTRRAPGFLAAEFPIASKSG